MNNSEIKLQFTSLVLRCVSVGNAALIMSEKDIGSVLVSSLKKHDTPFIQSLSELNEKIQEFMNILSKQVITAYRSSCEKASHKEGSHSTTC
jgi:anion-transporting  ArsA/GET3 family ATPase